MKIPVVCNLWSNTFNRVKTATPGSWSLWVFLTNLMVWGVWDRINKQIWICLMKQCSHLFQCLYTQYNFGHNNEGSIHICEVYVAWMCWYNESTVSIFNLFLCYHHFMHDLLSPFPKDECLLVVLIYPLSMKYNLVSLCVFHFSCIFTDSKTSFLTLFSRLNCLPSILNPTQPKLMFDKSNLKCAEWTVNHH